MQKLKHKELRNELKNGGITKVVPEGIHKISFIYELVQDAYPDLCDDDYHCEWQAPQPAWKHSVRNALGNLKGKGDIAGEEQVKATLEANIEKTK